MKNNQAPENYSNFLLYTGGDGAVKVDVCLQNETIWLTQKAMGQLFGVESHTITYHLKEIYKSAELDEKATARKIRSVQIEGDRQVNRNLDFYNLDVVISVGYRVNSYQATQFRIWATKTQAADLFIVQRPAITKHLSNIFKCGELLEESVCSNLEHTDRDSKTYKIKYYNLDEIQGN